MERQNQQSKNKQKALEHTISEDVNEKPDEEQVESGGGIPAQVKSDPDQFARMYSKEEVAAVKEKIADEKNKRIKDSMDTINNAEL